MSTSVLANLLEPAIGEPTSGNSYRGETCVDCPKGHVPATTYECEDQRRRCVPHYARWRQMTPEQREKVLARRAAAQQRPVSKPTADDEEQRRELEQAAAQCTSATETAKMLGLSTPSTIARARRLGVELPRGRGGRGVKREVVAP